MTPSSDTNSVTTIRAAISRSPLLQLVAYRFLLTPEHLHSPGRRRRGTLRSALDPVVHVGDALLPLEDPGALQLDVLRTDRMRVLMPSGGGPPGMIGYRTTRYARCVTPSVSVSPVCSSSMCSGPIEQASSPTEQDVDQVDPDLV